MILSSVFKNLKGFFPLFEWFYLFSLMLWFLMFPTFIGRGKEIVIFEINASEISSRIKSKVSQVSLFVMASLIFTFNLQKKSSEFFVV